MSDSNIVRRDERGRLLPGGVLNPKGRPPLDAPRFSRETLTRVCIEEDYEPIRALIALSRSPGASPYLQFAVHKEIAEYLYPKRKSVVIGDETGEGNTIHIAWDNVPTDPPPKQASDRDKAQKRFTNAMDDAHSRIIDAVMSDDKDDS